MVTLSAVFTRVAKLRRTSKLLWPSNRLVKVV
jgi:hypothetical protein